MVYCLAWAEGMPKLLRNGQPVDVDLSQKDLEVGYLVMVSTAAVTMPDVNKKLCTPGAGVVYWLAGVAAGDGVCAAMWLRETDF